jgi:hypothetical protein
MNARIYLSVLVLAFFLGCPSGPEVPIDDPIITDVTEPDGPETDPEETQISQEDYEAAFFDIEALIRDLNAVISRRSFIQWKPYLDEIYVETMSSKEKLDEINEKPVLKQANIELNHWRTISALSLCQVVRMPN